MQSDKMEGTRKIDKKYDSHSPPHAIIEAELNLVHVLIKLKGETETLSAATIFGYGPCSHAVELSKCGISCYQPYQRKFSVAGGPE